MLLGKSSYHVMMQDGIQLQWSSREEVLHVVSQCGAALAQAPAKLQQDRQVVLTAVQQDGMALEFAGRLRDDKEVVRAAVDQTGGALEFASQRLQNDRVIVCAALKKGSWAIQFASMELRRDCAVMMEALQHGGWAFEFAAAELQQNRDLVLDLVQVDGATLAFASTRVRNDPEVVLAAVKQDGCALKFASKELQEDREIVLAAVKQRGKALKYATWSLRVDSYLVLTAIRNPPFLMEHSELKGQAYTQILKAAESKIAQPGEENAPVVTVTDIVRTPKKISCIGCLPSGRSWPVELRSTATISDLAEEFVKTRPDDVRAFERIFLVVMSKRGGAIDEDLGGIRLIPFDWDRLLEEFVEVKKTSKSQDASSSEVLL